MKTSCASCKRTRSKLCAVSDAPLSGTRNVASVSVVGAVVGIALIVFAKHGRNIPIPFGPYLAGGGLIALFWGQTLTQSYLQLLAP